MKPKVWCHATESNKIKHLRFEGSDIYYLEVENIPWPYRIIDSLCCGDRYMHLCPGWFSNEDDYRGSTSDDWHGEPQNVGLSDDLEWVSKANHQEMGFSLWFKEKQI